MCDRTFDLFIIKCDVVNSLSHQKWLLIRIRLLNFNVSHKSSTQPAHDIPCDLVYVRPCLFPEIDQVLDGSGLEYPLHNGDT